MIKTFRIDWVTVAIYFLLVTTGILNIFSSTYDIESFSYVSYDSLAFKQFVFLILSLVSGVLILIAPSKFFQKFSSLIYLFSILLLIGLFAFGNTVHGHKSWYSIFGFSIQPTEIAKFATTLAVAKLLSEIQIDLKKSKSLIQVFLIILIPVILTSMQPDFGSENKKLGDLLFGDYSLGSLLSKNGFPTVPSSTDRAPILGEPFFSGGTNTKEYGSKHQNGVDAIQIELNRDGLRQNSIDRERFSKVFAEILIDYMRFHYSDIFPSN